VLGYDGMICMSEKSHQYVSRTNEGNWRIRGSRVSLDSVVGAYRRGQPPEVIKPKTNGCPLAL
jgi:uncharacterized protein (DUF433 family)